jgi:hypothetical protein
VSAAICLPGGARDALNGVFTRSRDGAKNGGVSGGAVLPGHRSSILVQRFVGMPDPE